MKVNSFRISFSYTTIFLLQRKETLLVEYKNKSKANKLVDRRIGENDPEMTLEDKMLQRFAKERQVGLFL